MGSSTPTCHLDARVKITKVRLFCKFSPGLSTVWVMLGLAKGAEGTHQKQEDGGKLNEHIKEGLMRPRSCFFRVSDRFAPAEKTSGGELQHECIKQNMVYF